MTIPAMHGLSNALRLHELRQEAIAATMANLETDGYKSELFTQQLLAGRPTPVLVAQIDLRQGPLTSSEDPRDLALDGPGFFLVETPQGVRWSRAVQFDRNAEGYLVNRQGMRLLDGENRPIRVADGPVAVTQEGDVFVDGILQGRLGLRDLAPGATVEKLGDGYFRASAPGTQSTARIRQSTREGSTADQVGTMVDMMTVNRHHEATVAALRLLDGMFESAATSVGRVNGP